MVQSCLQTKAVKTRTRNPMRYPPGTWVGGEKYAKAKFGCAIGQDFEVSCLTEPDGICGLRDFRDQGGAE